MPKGRRVAHWIESSKKHDKHVNKKTRTEHVNYMVHGGNAKTVPTDYHLPVDTQSKLMGFADKDCWQCKGTGVQGWKGQGSLAVVCRCVKKELARREKVYAETQQRLASALVEEAKADVVKLKAEGAEVPVRDCMACQKLSEGGGATMLATTLPPGVLCSTCNDTRKVKLTDEEWARFLAYKKANEAQEKVEKLLDEEQKKQAEGANASVSDDRPEALLAQPAGQVEAPGDGHA